MPWDRPRKPAFPAPIKRAILQRDPWCVHCGERPSTQADHIKPVAEGGDHSLSNGQGLCDPCHAAKTKREAQRGYRRWNNDKRPRQRRTPEKHPGVVE